MNNKKSPDLWAVFNPLSPDRPEPGLASRVDDLHAQLRQIEPASLARNTGSTYSASGSGQGHFELQLWGNEVILTYPEFEGRAGGSGQPIGIFNQAMLAYYFTISDGMPQAGNWIAYSELPDGKFYSQAFQGYTGNELAKLFGNNEQDFSEAAVQAGGRPAAVAQSLGDLSFVFHPLPLVSLMAVSWLGDEDFPASYRILFDAAASHHLTTDACAILGSTLTRRLINALAASQTTEANQD